MIKKILIGSLLVLTLLLLMPSIPAIQQNSVEEGIKQDIREKLDTITPDDIKYPILYSLLLSWFNFRIEQYTITGTLMFQYADEGQMYLAAIFALRLFFIMVPLVYNTNFWNDVSELLGWNWDIPLLY